MRLHVCFPTRQLPPFLYAEVIRPAPTEGKWGVLENRDYWCFSIKIMNIHSTCATMGARGRKFPWAIILPEGIDGGEEPREARGVMKWREIPTIAPPDGGEQPRACPSHS